MARRSKTPARSAGSVRPFLTVRPAHGTGDRAPAHRRSPRRGGRPITPVQEALEKTWTLKGYLKNAQISYLRAGILLAEVRDRKLFAALHHPDMESYAEARLGLQRATLYKYLQVHDWVKVSHPEWLAPKPKGFIPNLADSFALVWIEKQLARTNIDAATRSALEDLRAKALAGKLSSKEFSDYRHGRHGPANGLKSLLQRLQSLKRYAMKLANTPPITRTDLETAITHLSAAMDQRKYFRKLKLHRPWTRKNSRRSMSGHILRKSPSGWTEGRRRA